MKIFIGADHNGYDMKAALIAALQKSGHEVIDEGDKNHDPADDFPQFASRVVTAMRAEGEAVGILICGSGQGMCIAANRYKGIRASLVWDEQEAHAARNDDDSNVLCLPARFINDVQAIAIAEKWLQTPFAGAARFKRRIAELDLLA
jgi:ribose 5-phosphate isomerase B